MKVTGVLIVVLLLSVLLLSPATVAAATDSAQLLRFPATVWWVPSLQTYGIMSADGKKYDPIKRLPRKFQKDRMEVVIEGKIRDDLVGPNMWGKALEIVKISKVSEYFWPEERQAIRMLLSRMDAFNSKDLGKLQQIDDVAKGLTPDQFNTWLDDNGNFILNYVEFVPDVNAPSNATTINGFCLYSRQRLHSIAMSGNVNYSLMRFTLTKTADGWKFTGIDSYRPDDVADMDLFIKQLLEKSKEKFGTTNLAEWKG
jgi:hypothetical protein